MRVCVCQRGGVAAVNPGAEEDPNRLTLAIHFLQPNLRKTTWPEILNDLIQQLRSPCVVKTNEEGQDWVAGSVLTQRSALPRG